MMLQLHDMPARISPKRDAWKQLKDIGYFRDGRVENPDLSWVSDYWKNQPAFIIGSSPALQNMINEGFTLDMLDGKNVIGVNHIIEKYDRFPIHLFLDQRFIEKTKYDIKKYKGKIFCRNNVNLFSGDVPGEVYRFHASRPNEQITDNLNNGVYCDLQSGLCALHLAIVAGANPIYLIGMDTGGSKALHFDGYPNNKNTIYSDNAKRNRVMFPFSKYKDRIINLDTKGVLSYFKKQNWKEVFKPDNKIKDIKQNAVICQVSKFDNMTTWNEISRQIYSLTSGNHIRINIENKKLPKADIYVLDCVINGANEFINFQKPAGSKVISVVHSTSKCFPAVCSDKVVVLSESEKKRMLMNGFNAEVIPCSIDLENYKYPVDYSKKTYGRITRFSTGKVHSRFNDVVNFVKGKYPDSQCIMITKTGNKNPNIEYIESVENDNNDAKAQTLSKLTLFADYHNTFIETFSLSLLEGMAAGLPIILYSIAPQASMIEVMGGCGIVCSTEKEFTEAILTMLPDAEKKKEFGLRSRTRAKEFSVKKMIDRYNNLFAEVLKCV